jgi:hypothetical protein
LLIDAARNGDEPSAADRRRVRSALARKIAVGAAAGVAAATASHAAAGGVAAAGTSGAAGGAIAGAGVGGAAAAGGTASIAAGVVAPVFATAFGAKLLVTVAIVGVVSAGTVGYVHHEAAKAKVQAAADSHVVTVERAAPRSVPVAPLALRPRTVPVAPPPAAIPPADVPVAATPAAATAPATATPSVAPKSVAATAPAAGASPSDLDIEIALLQDANGAIRDKDGARALRLLDEHTRRFPNGALGEESEAARVFALCQLGRADEARDVAGRFLREHPRSPLVPRVSRACDAEPSTF